LNLKEFLILIIDDDFAKDDPLVIKLEEIYHKVIVEQPKNALVFIENNLSTPIIVLLDVNMPHHLNGHQVLEKIREKSYLIPVIIFTAVQEEEETFSDFINNKAAGYVSKDESSENIINIINKVVIESENQIDNALEDWIEKQSEDEKNKPFIAGPDGKKYSLNQVLSEIRLQTAFGKDMSGKIIKLSIDLLSRGKKQI